ncbi:MAG TPA: type II secretion system protein N [Candidatus Dependentiae bacterium]|nr:type II secretion system protein N [Candidatus Dependentiae bacterium]HRQ62993.1 type II secretion system protein N [Candidatus Dependentiae bacterium]
MKHPFWIANSILLFLLLVSLIVMYIARTTLSEREEIEPRELAPRKKEATIAINISKIYENDLFDTYIKSAQQPAEIALPRMPEPPRPQIAPPPKALEPQFVDPLDVTLKGIVVLSAQDVKNRAIIEDNKTKKEKTYKVGDTIEDAQLIRIFGNKIILLRANGQQEVLYLREQDAQLDPMYAQLGNWHEVVQEITAYNFIINQKAFLMRIKNLAQFIDLVNLTSVYKAGQSVGCRVGQLENNSLGTALGLESGDIIVTINNIPTATTDDRLKIYKAITAMQENDEINVKILRRNNNIELTYLLQEFKKDEKSPDNKKQSEQEKVKIMRERYKFAPTVQELRNQEKQFMYNHGKAPRTAMPDKKITEENTHE